MIVLGIDPGYAIVGYGVVEMKNNRYRTLEHGAVTTKAGTDFNRRLEIIYDGIAQVLAQYHPDAISVEKLYFSNNKTTGIGVAEARGVILLAAQKARVPVFEYTPVQVKLAVTGYGKALKPQVMEMTRRLLCLREVPKPDDTADALAIAICHWPCLRHGAAAVFEVTPSIWTESTEGIERTKAMFYSLTGKLVHMEPGVVAIECGGVAFKCFTSMNTQKNMPRIGETATVYTHLNVREDALDLYGFSTKSELNCYKMLTTISGVGPKAALSILSEMTPEGVAMAGGLRRQQKVYKGERRGPEACTAHRAGIERPREEDGLYGRHAGTDRHGRRGHCFCVSERRAGRTGAYCARLYTVRSRAGRGEAGRLPLYGRTYSRRFKEYGKPLLIHAERRVLFA